MNSLTTTRVPRWTGLLLLVLALPLFAFGQSTVAGTVTDAGNGAALPGANVYIDGTTMGAAADADGKFMITNVPNGTYTIIATVIGYENGSQAITISGSMTVNFALEASAIQLSALEVFASRATRETPVAYSDVQKEDVELRLASRDIPLVLNTTPSFYSTNSGGGAGDARLSVRGFNQRNVSIMINGVPTNDMENGWLYWSNWDGVSDATSSIQMQRGLSAVNLATPSIGGTMNIITDPAARDAGGKFRQEIGSDGFLKTTLNYNTGMLMNDKFALSGTVVRKTGDGYKDATWTDAWAYYLGASFALSDNDRFELYAIGAPQRHGQNLYMQNIAVYDQDYAKDLDDYDTDAFFSNGGKFIEEGHQFNQNWAPVSKSYKGTQYYQMIGIADGVDRHAEDEISERENYYHKPQINLNWFHKFSEQFRLSSILYYSGGTGGGTGTMGSVYSQDANGELGDDDYKYYYGPSPWTRDWDATIAMNAADADTFYVDKSMKIKDDQESVGILRNSVNQQWTIGAIVKANYDLSESLKLQGGLDWRTAEIDHYREVRDLLGGDYFVFEGNDFDGAADYNKKLGDKIDYYNTNTVNWLGFFGQADYTMNALNAYGMFGYSTISYDFTDHFKDDGNGDEFNIKSGTIGGYQIKGGASYGLTKALRGYANFGYISKVPIFDDVIDDATGIKNDDYTNQLITSIEGGVNFGGGPFTLNVNGYYTKWMDRSLRNQEFELESGAEVLVFLRGVDQLHTGLEIEGAFQPIKMARLDFAASFGNWTYTDDASGDFRIEELDSTFSATFYLKDLKIGDAPQTQLAFGISLFPVEGATVQLVYKTYANFYSEFDPFTRTELEDVDGDGNATDRPQSWEVPNYSVVDLHANYTLPMALGPVKLQAFAHVFNLLNATYIQDAVDNSQYNAWDYDHDADDAEVHFGLPLTFNVGLNILF